MHRMFNSNKWCSNSKLTNNHHNSRSHRCNSKCTSNNLRRSSMWSEQMVLETTQTTDFIRVSKNAKETR
jgi:hypothetical protein